MPVEFNPELLKRYGGNVPRYTSYPTALEFNEAISPADYARAADARSGFAEYFAQEISSLGALEADELVRVSDEEIAVTTRGEFLLRNVAVVFDAYARAAGQPRRASKAI